MLRVTKHIKVNYRYSKQFVHIKKTDFLTSIHKNYQSTSNSVLARAKRYIALNKIYKVLFSDLSDYNNWLGVFILPHTNLQCRKVFMESMLSNEAITETIRNKPEVEFDIDKLLSMNKNTLGHQYATFLVSNQISQFIMPKGISDYAYATNRIIQIHDIYHVMIDASTQFTGETRVAAFTSAQINGYFPSVISIGVGLVAACLNRQDLIREVYKNLIEGYTLGLQAKQFFTQDWNSLWETDIEQLRQQLNINIEMCGSLAEGIIYDKSTSEDKAQIEAERDKAA